jgi:hypothetical protein
MEKHHANKAAEVGADVLDERLLHDLEQRLDRARGGDAHASTRSRHPAHLSRQPPRGGPA